MYEYYISIHTVTKLYFFLAKCAMVHLNDVSNKQTNNNSHLDNVEHMSIVHAISDESCISHRSEGIFL